MKISGRAIIEHRRRGVLMKRQTCTNIITALGDALVASRMSNGSTNAISHMAVGDGYGGTYKSETLVNELGRVALTSTTQGTSGNDNLVTYIATFPAGTGTGTITEAGLLNATSNGVLFNWLGGFDPIGKTADDEVTFTMIVRFGSST